VDGVLYVKRDGIAYITLDRPERGNALSGDMRRRLGEIWHDVRVDPAVRVAIVTGSGDRHFCTGADMVDLAESADTEPALPIGPPMEEELRFTARQVKVWKPVICAVNGTAAGAGLHFVVDADIVLAAEDASFVDTHVNVGQVGAIENIGLAKRLPLGTVLRMTLMGKAYRLTAERAHHFGLVDEIVPRADLISTAEQMARAMMQGSPRTSALSQEAIWKSLETGYHEAMDFGWALVRMHWSHPDALEGPRAFAERREPKWL
jgi:E-phenylitaconyl-CoA hydratase